MKILKKIIITLIPVCVYASPAHPLAVLADALQTLQQSLPNKISSKPPIDLTWCPCIPKEIRMQYAEEFAQDIAKTFKPTTFTRAKPLMYASIASGGLLQDYRILKKLIQKHGFNHIHIFIADIDYPVTCGTKKEAPEGAYTQLAALHNTPFMQKATKLWRQMDAEENSAKIKTLEQQYDNLFLTKNDPVTQAVMEKYGIPTLAELVEQYEGLLNEFTTSEEQIPLFEGLLKSLVEKTNGSIEVNYFDSSSAYIAYIEQNTAEKPHTLSLVDPDLRLFDVTKMPQESNVLSLHNNRFFYAKPYSQPGQLWDTQDNNDADRKKIAALLQPYKNATTGLAMIQNKLSESINASTTLLVSPYLTIQYVLGKTMRPTTLFYHLQKDPAKFAMGDAEIIMHPFKVTQLVPFIHSDQVAPFFETQVNEILEQPQATSEYADIPLHRVW